MINILFVVALACCYTVYLKYIRTVLLFGSWKEKIGANFIQDSWLTGFYLECFERVGSLFLLSSEGIQPGLAPLRIIC